MAVGFSTADSFPFTVGDKVMVEGTSVGVGSTGKGLTLRVMDTTYSSLSLLQKTEVELVAYHLISLVWLRVEKLLVI